LNSALGFYLTTSFGCSSISYYGGSNIIDGLSIKFALSFKSSMNYAKFNFFLGLSLKVSRTTAGF
jgi:hypothetical protein